MEKRRCAICSSLLTEDNKTAEHIIPNSIGGKRTVTYFICDKCNNEKGETWDFALSESYKDLALFLRIKRDRGTVPSRIVSTTAGEEFILDATGRMTIPRPTYNKTITDEKIHITMTARNDAEAEKMIKDVTKKYAKQGKKVVLTKTTSSTYPKGMLSSDMQYGGEEVGRSFIKSLLALLSTTIVPVNSCQDALNYLQGSTQANFGYFYSSDLIKDRPRLPIHCLHVEGDTTHGLIKGYLEYFGSTRIVSCLSSNYTGAEFSETYSINPLTGEALNLKVDLSTITPEKIQSSYEYNETPKGALEKTFDHFLPDILANHEEEHCKEVAREATQYAFANCGAEEGEILTEEHIHNIIKHATSYLAPWGEHQLNRKKIN